MQNQGFRGFASDPILGPVWEPFRRHFRPENRSKVDPRRGLGASRSRLGRHFLASFSELVFGAILEAIFLPFWTIFGAKLERKNHPKPWRVVQNQGFRGFVSDRIWGPFWEPFWKHFRPPNRSKIDPRRGLGASWGPLGASWRRLGPSWGRLGASCKRLGASKGRLGAILVGLGRVLGRLGRVLGPSWAALGPSWGILGPPWAVLGLSWAVLRPSWAVFEPFWAVLGLF